jgi:hypothetical protein
MVSGRLARVAACASTLVRYPRESARQLMRLPELVRGAALASHWQNGSARGPRRGNDALNPLRAYFDSVSEGPGVWKWLHYFDHYHRHLQKLIDRPVTVVEVGVYSGGSLGMWRRYFGDGCRLHGVDIEEACRAYENGYTTIHIGDQADRAFWDRFRRAVPHADVLIDDGGHEAEQQMVTLEEMLPHLSPGGIYIAEDIHGGNHFAAFVNALATELNAFATIGQPELASRATPFQSAIGSIHLYPFAVVIEKREVPVERFDAPKHGTRWQPFLDDWRPPAP